MSIDLLRRIGLMVIFTLPLGRSFAFAKSNSATSTKTTTKNKPTAGNNVAIIPSNKIIFVDILISLTSVD